MTRPQHPYLSDPERLEAVVRSGLLTDDVGPAIDRWTRMATELVGAPMSLLTVADGERTWVLSEAGMTPGSVPDDGTPLAESFCQHVVAARDPVVIDDAREDPRVAGTPAVSDPGILAYAGQPVTSADGQVLGSFCVMDMAPRAWDPGQLALLEDLAAGLVAEVQLRGALRQAVALQVELGEQACLDALTGLPNRRRLDADLARAVDGDEPALLAMFDLNGFKLYNDAFGHPAGDALLARLGHKLAAAAEANGGTAYRLGGDEFCVLVPDQAAVAAAATELEERGDGFAVTSACGAVDLRAGAVTAEQAMQVADQRLYGSKATRSDPARRQAHDVLRHVLRERAPDLDDHVREVAALAHAVGVGLGLAPAELEALGLAAELHDIGKVAIPDQIINKPGPLDADEWDLMRRHTLTGERILNAAPALRHVATAVRASHERWDGGGYPDGLAGEAIPSPARIVLACDAFDAMTSDRPYAPARPVAEAIAELQRSAGTQLDPAVVIALVAVVAARR